MAQDMLNALAFRKKRHQADSCDAPFNLNSHNHNQHAGRPCFSLAVLIERLTSTPRYDISLLGNRASHVGAYAIRAHADCSRLDWSTTAEPSRAR
jgi:hypothetical protein